MNEKISSFMINSVLAILFVGILLLPAASSGLLGVQDRGEVLSVKSENSLIEENVAEDTSPSTNIRTHR